MTLPPLRFDPGQWQAWQRAMLAFLAGALTVLAFAPFGLALLVLPGLAALSLLIGSSSTSGMALREGYLFGLGLLGFGVFWLRISIAQFGGVTLPLAIVITLSFIASMAVFFGLAAWLSRRFGSERDIVFYLLQLPAIWALLEWLRGWFLGGFPWLSLGYSQIDLPLAGYAPVGGVFLIGLLLLFSAGGVLLWRRVWPLLLVALIWLGGWALQHLDWTQPLGDPFEVSLVQGNVPQEEKWLASQFQPTIRLYRSMTEQVPDSALVVWPETAVPAFDSRVEASLLAPLHASMQQQGRDLLTGIVVGHSDTYYNALVSLGISGRDQYLKRHLVPFGEYLPLDRWLRPLLDWLHIPMSDFSAGPDTPPLIRLAGYQAALNICYEDAFGNEVIRGVPEAAYLINASNDAWFGDSLAPHQHLQIARMRAAETQRYLLRATNTGISAIIDHQGRATHVGRQFEAVTVTGPVVPRSGTTPYGWWGDWFVVAVAITMLLIAGSLQRKGAGG